MRIISSLVILLSLISCSRKTDVELYTEGKAAEERKDYQTAAQLYEEAVEKFQSSAYAESSLIHLAFMYNNNIKDAQKAVNAYRRFYELFPNSKQAPTMLFLSAFIYNNELHQLDSARQIYETFIQKYPDHELAPSAKFELSTLGQDPGQVLNPAVTLKNEMKKDNVKKAGKK
jgi:outer membrane assembly lipoprotein YfiO